MWELPALSSIASRANNAHPGSWQVAGYSLPDLGYTESIADWYGGRNAQGGSNIFGNTNLNQASEKISPQPSNVLGASTSSPYGPDPRPQSQAPTNSGGNTTTGRSGSGTPSPQSTSTNPLPGIDPLMQEINSAYDSRMNFLNQAESQLRNDLPTYQQEANRQYDASVAQLDANRNQAYNEIDSSRMQADKRKQDALSAARRLYNEMLQQGNQRYGGASSAGQAFTELNAVEQQRRSGDINRGYEDTARAIMQQKSATDEKYNATVMQLQASRDQQMNQAQRDFQNKLMEINSLRDEAQNNKSNMRLQALQDYRNQLFSINLQQMQFQQQLTAQKQAADQQLANAGNALSGFGNTAWGASNDFVTGTTVDPQTGLTVTDGAYGGQNPEFVGRINQQYNPNEDPYADPTYF